MSLKGEPIASTLINQHNLQLYSKYKPLCSQISVVLSPHQGALQKTLTGQMQSCGSLSQLVHLQHTSCG